MPKRVWLHPCKEGGKHLGTYNTWRQMLSRCTNPQNKSFKDYGARGVGVCEEWLSYDNFYEWAIANGYEQGLTLDRKDNDAGYSPENCRWVDRKVQGNNKRNVKRFGGETISQIAERTGLNYTTVYQRLVHGKSVEAPLNEGKSHKRRSKK